MPKLLVKDTEGTYLIDLRVDEAAMLGRSFDCDIVVRTPRASRRHVVVEPLAGGHAVRDLGSTNGSLLNGSALGSEQAPLADGDLIALGGCTIVYRASP